jgi:hypothetical protein
MYHSFYANPTSGEASTSAPGPSREDEGPNEYPKARNAGSLSNFQDNHTRGKVIDADQALDIMSKIDKTNVPELQTGYKVYETNIGKHTVFAWERNDDSLVYSKMYDRKAVATAKAQSGESSSVDTALAAMMSLPQYCEDFSEMQDTRFSSNADKKWKEHKARFGLYGEEYSAQDLDSVFQLLGKAKGRGTKERRLKHPGFVVETAGNSTSVFFYSGNTIRHRICPTKLFDETLEQVRSKEVPQQEDEFAQELPSAPTPRLNCCDSVRWIENSEFTMKVRPFDGKIKEWLTKRDLTEEQTVPMGENVKRELAKLGVYPEKHTLRLARYAKDGTQRFEWMRKGEMVFLAVPDEMYKREVVDKGVQLSEASRFLWDRRIW